MGRRRPANPCLLSFTSLFFFSRIASRVRHQQQEQRDFYLRIIRMIVGPTLSENAVVDRSPIWWGLMLSMEKLNSSRICWTTLTSRFHRSWILIKVRAICVFVSYKIDSSQTRCFIEKSKLAAVLLIIIYILYNILYYIIYIIVIIQLHSRW